MDVAEVRERWADKWFLWNREPDPLRLRDLATRLDIPGLKVPRMWLPTGHIILPPVGGGARAFDGSTTWLKVESAPATAAPLTMGAWASSTNTTGAQCCMALNRTDTTTVQFALFFGGNVAGDPIRFRSNNGGGSNIADTTTGYSSGVWHHVCGVEASSTSRAAYIDGGSKGTNTTSTTPAAITRLSIGVLSGSSDSALFTGNIAEAFIYTAALADAEIAVMAATKCSPLTIHPGSLAFYAPLVGNYSPEIDMRAGAGLTVTAATKANHPRMLYPPTQRQRWVVAGAAPPAATVRMLASLGVGT